MFPETLCTTETVAESSAETPSAPTPAHGHRHPCVGNRGFPRGGPHVGAWAACLGAFVSRTDGAPIWPTPRRLWAFLWRISAGCWMTARLSRPTQGGWGRAPDGSAPGVIDRAPRSVSGLCLGACPRRITVGALVARLACWRCSPSGDPASNLARLAFAARSDCRCPAGVWQAVGGRTGCGGGPIRR